MNSTFSNPADLVHSMFTSGGTLVFPSEISARFWLADYALNSSQGVVRSDSALSWDTFRALFLPRHEHLEPSNQLVRRLFAHEFLTGPQRGEVPWFASGAYPEATDAYADKIARLVPRFDAVLRQIDRGAVQAGIIHQIEILHASYTAFLRQKSLFEPSYEKASLEYAPESVQGKSYIVVFPSLIPGVDELLADLGSPQWIQCVDLADTILMTGEGQKDDRTSVTIFDNESQEVKDVVRRFRRAIEQGVPVRDMAVTTPDNESLIRHLVEEARIHDVPLRVVRGFSPLSHPAGRFFSRLKGLYDASFSLEAMKDLLLDTGIPWRSLSLHRRLISSAVQLRIGRGDRHRTSSDEWLHKLFLATSDRDKPLLDFYRTLRDTVVSIMEARTARDLRSRLSYFQQEFFCDERWTAASTAEATDVYTFCMQQLVKVENALRTAGMTEYPALFSLFLSYISDARYVPRTSTGIPLYIWPQSASLMIPYHYVVGLDHEATLQHDNPADFLPDTAYLSAEREERDRTPAFFRMYRTCLVHGRLSVALQGYEGIHLPPSCMVEASLTVPVSDRLSDDSWKDELRLWRGDTPQNPFSTLPGQRHWQQTHAQVVQNRMGRKQDMALNPAGQFRVAGGQELLSLSATQLDAFANCPFTWALQWGMGVRAADYEVPAMDHLFMGNLIHRVYQRFFGEITLKHALYDGQAYSQEYREVLDHIWDEEFIRLSAGKDAPAIPTLRWIRSALDRQLPWILSEEKAVFSGTLSWALEKELQEINRAKGYHLSGRIDRIVMLDATLTDFNRLHGQDDLEFPDASASERHFAVIDYKKGEVAKQKKYVEAEAPPSYQLPVYHRLVSRQLSASVDVAAYYSVKNGAYSVIWDGRSDSGQQAVSEDLCRKLDEALEKILEDMVAAVRKGNYAATPSDEACKGCDFRSICRRRYALS